MDDDFKKICARRFSGIFDISFAVSSPRSLLWDGAEALGAVELKVDDVISAIVDR